MAIQCRPAFQRVGGDVIAPGTVALDGLGKCPTGSSIVSSTHRRLGQPAVVGRAGIEARRRPERGRRLRELPRLQLRLALSVPLVGTALGLSATLDDQQRGTNHHPAQASEQTELALHG